MNDRNVVPVQVASAIKPRHLVLAESGAPLTGTLVKYEFEQCAAELVRYGQSAGFWVGLTYRHQAMVQSPYGQMMAEGFLSETETSDGWLYWLTPLAISQIYLVQNEAAITSLQGQIRRAQEESILSRIRRHFKEVFAPMSAGV